MWLVQFCVISSVFLHNLIRGQGSISNYTTRRAIIIERDVHIPIIVILIRVTMLIIHRNIFLLLRHYYSGSGLVYAERRQELKTEFHFYMKQQTKFLCILIFGFWKGDVRHISTLYETSLFPNLICRNHVLFKSEKSELINNFDAMHEIPRLEGLSFWSGFI